MATLKAPLNDHDHIQGDLRAPVTLLEYGDYECPHCAVAHPVVRRVQRHFGSRLCFAFRHFPLTSIHPNAEAAAETAEFAGTNGRFWEMHDFLYANQDRLGFPLFLAAARALGLSEAALRQSLSSGAHAEKLREDFLGGVRSGVNGTPSFFINGRRYDAPHEFEYFVEIIEELVPARP